MAFVKVLSVALCLSAASAAPQNYGAATRTLVSQPQVVRVAQPQFVRVAQPQQLVHTVAAAPTVVRTVNAAPATHHVVHSAPVQQTIVRAAPTVTYDEVEEVEGDASYSFGYSIADQSSGDSKTREETADHGVVRGSYSVADPDGRVRVVTYTADAENGFQAQVTYDGEEGPVAIPFDAPQQTQQTVISAAPAQTIVAARNNQAVHAVHNVAAAPSVVRTVSAAPQAVHAVHNVHAAPSVVRTVSAAPQAVHAVHNVHAAPTVVRSSNLVHAAPATTVVRSNGAQHFVQAQPQFVQAQPQFVRALPFGTSQLIHV